MSGSKYLDRLGVTFRRIPGKLDWKEEVMSVLEARTVRVR